MSSSTMSLIGLYNYYPDLFKYLTVPDELDKSTLIDTILLRSGEFEVLYPDPEFLEFSIGAWSRKWAPTFDRWVNALSIEYNPLENYDRIEDWTDNRDISGHNNTADNGTESQSKTDTEHRTEGGSTSSSTSGRTNSTTTNKVSAYDAGDALTTKDQSTLVGADSSGTSGTTSLTVSAGDVMSLTGSHLNSIVVSHMTADDLVHSGRIHGNIGVTTSQQMLEAELNLGYWNIYNKITDLFLTEFVIPVY